MLIQRVPSVQVVTSRDVPLGGTRAMHVRRTLPQRTRSLVGAWCFGDHYGRDDVAQSGGMDVPPHPHTGLQTASWLFTGEIEHRDSNGVLLWLARPEPARHLPRDFRHHVPPPVTIPGGTARILLGALAGQSRPSPPARRW